MAWFKFKGNCFAQVESSKSTLCLIRLPLPKKIKLCWAGLFFLLLFFFCTKNKKYIFEDFILNCKIWPYIKIVNFLQIRTTIYLISRIFFRKKVQFLFHLGHPIVSSKNFTRKKFFNGVRFGWQPIGWLINVINLNKTAHSSEIRGLCLVKWDPSEILQNLHMFWKRWKRAFCFLIPKIWQILKCLAWSIHQAWNPLFAKSVLMLLVCIGWSAAAISWPTR